MNQSMIYLLAQTIDETNELRLTASWLILVSLLLLFIGGILVVFIIGRMMRRHFFPERKSSTCTQDHDTVTLDAWQESARRLKNEEQSSDFQADDERLDDDSNQKNP